MELLLTDIPGTGCGWYAGEMGL